VRIGLRGLPKECLPHSCSAVVKVRGESILRGSVLRVLRPHDADEDRAIGQPLTLVRFASHRHPLRLRPADDHHGPFLIVEQKAEFSRNSPSSDCSSCRTGMRILSFPFKSLFCLRSNYLDEASCPKRNRCSRYRSPRTNKRYQFPPCGRMYG
jgi:hypothetical protein